MCYIAQSAGDVAVRKKELSAKAWVDLAREAVDGGMVFLLLTGGEVFLRTDFFEIYNPLTRLGLNLTLFSNGTIITPELARRLADSPPNRIEITLYGASASTYEAVTGDSGAFSRCCAGIDALVSRGMPLLLKTTLTRHNVADLPGMQQMARAWGVPFARAGWQLFKRTNDRSSAVESCRLSPADGVELEERDFTDQDNPTEEPLPESGLLTDLNFYCHAGKSAFAVTAAGEMNVCLNLRLPGALPREVSFRAAWEEVQRFVDSAPPLCSSCLACDARVYCPRCPAWCHLETDTLTKPVAYLCDIACARQKRHVQIA